MTKPIKILTLLTFCLFLQFPLLSNAYAATAKLEPGQQTQTDLAIWTFPNTASDRLVADGGILSGQMRLSAEGGRGGSFSQPTFGAGANAGQLFVSGWDATHLSDKYWLIQATSPVHSILAMQDDIEISFSAHGSNTGPRDFALEAYVNGSWIHIADYVLTATTQDFTFQLPNQIKESEYFQIRFRASSNTAINGSTVAPAGTSRIFNIQFTGTATPRPMDDIARWQFTSLALFNSNATTATGGSQPTSTFGLAGGGNLTMGAGSAAGQLFVNGWGSAAGLTADRYWHIRTQTIGYSNIHISFGAHSSNTGPRDFVIEANIGNGWIHVASYTLENSAQTFSFTLPAFASNAPVLEIRLRPGNNIAINGSAIQPAGTSRMYDITIQGIPIFSPDAFTFTQAVEQGAEYTVVLLATGVLDSALKLTYNPAIVEITNIHELTNADINIVSHQDGVLIFMQDNNETDILKIIVSFTAKTNGIAMLIFE